MYPREYEPPAESYWNGAVPGRFIFRPEPWRSYAVRLGGLEETELDRKRDSFYRSWGFDVVPIIQRAIARGDYEIECGDPDIADLLRLLLEE